MIKLKNFTTNQYKWSNKEVCVNFVKSCEKVVEKLWKSCEKVVEKLMKLLKIVRQMIQSYKKVLEKMRKSSFLKVVKEFWEVQKSCKM